MRNILKIATLLLVLLAMVGTASADVGTISIEMGSNNTDFDVKFNWDGSGTNFNISIDNSVLTEITVPTGPNSYTHTTGSFSPGTTYTVTVTDLDDLNPSTNVSTEQFTILDISQITNFKSNSSTNDSNYSLEWTNSGSYGVEIYNGSAWFSSSSTTEASVPGNALNGNTLTYRLTDGYNKSANASVTYPGFSIPAPTIGAGSIIWDLSNSVIWGAYGSEVNYFVYNNTSSPVTTTALTGNLLNASGLIVGDEYTLKIQGNNASGYGITVVSGPFPMVFIPLIDKDKTDRLDSSGDPIHFDFENDTVLRMNATALNSFGNCNFTWTLNNSTNNVNVTTKNNVNNSTFEWKFNKTGDYKLELKIEKFGDPTVNQTITWNIKVTEKSSGNRIWSDGMPTTYEWNARSFAGFYYNLDNGDGKEMMKITGIGRSLSKGSIHYTTQVSDVSFDYSGWGKYQIVGFMGDKYYAGSGSESLMKSGNLSKVLVDTSSSENYRVGQYIPLEEGYSIRIDQISVNGNQAFLVIEKDGKQVSSGIVGSNGTFTFEKTIGNVKVPFIRVHVKNVFMGTESSLVTIDALFQISDKLTKLESGTKIDKMEISSISGNTIEMKNHESVSLSQGSEITLMGKMKFIVADDSTLRFAPTIEYTDPGIYEIRGTVSDYSDSNNIVLEWTPQNFEGFYYNINDSISVSEKITIKQTDLNNSSRRIDKGNLTYTANSTIVRYEYNSWGTYSVVGFMGEKYYAGTGGSLLKGGNLSKVLIDADEGRRMYVGQYITLEEGYSVKVDQINVNGNSVFFILEKDGREVDSGIIRGGDDYVYKKKVGNTDVEFIKIHVDSVFMGTESSLVSISGLFQASDKLTKLESDAKYGKMKVDSYDSNGIVLSSDESITLSNGNDVEFMKVGNQSMYFKVGDSNDNTLRFAPIVKYEIGANTTLEVSVSPSDVEVGSRVSITVMDRGTTLEGVVVSANGSTIGTTNSSGMVEYTTNSVGTIKISAEKSGYVNGSASLTVKEKALNMAISVSPETMYYGTSGTIRVTDSLNGSAVPDVSILVGNASAGTTNSNGELTYTFNTTGNVTVQGSKNGYINATRSVSVTQRDTFNYSNFVMKPDAPAANANTKLSFDATNIGVSDGSHTLRLTVTDSSGSVIAEDSQTVSVEVGKTKTVTLSFKAPAEGTYRLTLTESDSNKAITLPSSMSSIYVGPSKAFGSTLIYIVLAIIGIILLAIIGVIAYLFGVKGARRGSYKEVAGEIVDDFKMRFRR